MRPFSPRSNLSLSLFSLFFLISVILFHFELLLFLLKIFFFLTEFFFFALSQSIILVLKHLTLTILHKMLLTPFYKILFFYHPILEHHILTLVKVWKKEEEKSRLHWVCPCTDGQFDREVTIFIEAQISQFYKTGKKFLSFLCSQVFFRQWKCPAEIY